MKEREKRIRSVTSASTQLSVTMEVPSTLSAGLPPPCAITFATKFELEVDLEHPLVRHEIDRVVGDDNFAAAFARMLEWGEVAVDEQVLSDSATESHGERWPGQPVSVTVNDANGRPLRPLKDPAAQAHWLRMKAARLRAGMFAMLLSETLDRVEAKYRPDPASVESTFRAQFISDRNAMLFARALHYYCQGHYDDAARAALPSIEAVIRCLVQATRGSSYVEPKSGRDGHESTMGKLIRMLPPGLPESFRHDLLALLTEPLGLNLRNLHLHGLVQEDSKHDAAIVLYTAARFTLITANVEGDPLP